VEGVTGDLPAVLVGRVVSDLAVWAPAARRVRVVVAGTGHEMKRAVDGWWTAPEGVAAPPGTDYAYQLDDDPTPLPDPRSAWQPAGVHGASRVYDHAGYAWGDGAWTGRQLPGSVIYELHVGTFTPEGTFDAAIGRLDHLVELGIDLVQLLPVAGFNGEHGWGYDGVAWYAPHQPYGGPDGLKRLVDACHQRGLGVVLDVVYNHFGPSGAYAPLFGPYLAQGSNSWGRSLNLDGPQSDEVRRYVIDNALMWLRDYHLDGLRLDAVHALVDRSAVHLLEQLSVEVESLSTQLNRPLSLIAESDLNDPRLITPREAGGYGLHAQWNDDVHHALHALLTGERQGYYGDFGSVECVAAVWQQAFYHAGTWSSFRGCTHGRPVDRERVPGHRFVVFLQNHDQIGNRATGDRLPATLPPALLKIGATLLLTGPYTPMLFMGEEWGASTPWQYFSSHPEPDLGEAVRTGRRAEFAAHGWPEGEVPDPQDRSTMEASRLDWSEPAKGGHRELLELYRRLIALRRSVPDLSDPWLNRVDVQHGNHYLLIRRGRCAVVANLAEERQRIVLDDRPAEVLIATEQGLTLSSDAVELPGISAAVLALR
jgi:maltooligosyltrehalose trehalohydrolase